MGNCLVTKLKSGISADLPILNKIRVRITPRTNPDVTPTVLFGVSEANKLHFECDRPVKVTYGSAVLAESTTNFTTDKSGVVINFLSSDPVYFKISNKDYFDSLQCSNRRLAVVECEDEDIAYSNIKYLSVEADSLVGFDDLSTLLTLGNLASFGLGANPNLHGNLDDIIDHFETLSGFAIQGTPNSEDVYGTIMKLSKYPNISTINIVATKMEGEMAPLLNGYAQSGRTADMKLMTNRTVTVNGNPYFWDKTVRFNSGMVNPTAEDTARGWQLV